MINTKTFNAALGRVMAAAGKEDLVQAVFTATADRNICQLTCCDGKGLQVMMSIAFTGECSEGVAIVKASTLAGILRSYEALGFKEFGASIVKGETENVLVLTNGKGTHKLPLAEKMSSIDLRQAQEGVLYAAACRTKDLQAAVKNVSYAIGNNEYTAGMFFRAEENGYTVMATDTYFGAQSRFAAEFKSIKGGAADAAKDFFVGTCGVKAILALKGEAANLVVTKNFLILKDADGTMAFAGMNAKSFPIPAMNQIMVGKGAGLQGKKHLYDAELQKGMALALIDLAEATSTSKDVKAISFRAEQKGGTYELCCGTQAVESAKLMLVDEAGEASFSTALLKSVLTNIGEDTVTIKFVKGLALFYGRSEDCLAFLMGRGK